MANTNALSFSLWAIWRAFMLSAMVGNTVLGELEGLLNCGPAGQCKPALKERETLCVPLPRSTVPMLNGERVPIASLSLCSGRYACGPYLGYAVTQGNCL